LLTDAEPAVTRLGQWSERRRSLFGDPVEVLTKPARTRIEAQAEGLAD
jgi:hypothetical protein